MNNIDNNFSHIPVLLKEVGELLSFPLDRSCRMIDGTIGGGGHSSYLLEKYPNLELLGIDRDQEALTAAHEKLAPYKNRVTLVRGNYADLAIFAKEHAWDKIDGILLDIGVSSPQIDHWERGFSWRGDGPLDMRMDQRSELTASRWLNRSTQEELTKAFRNYGELKSAGKLAAAVVETRVEHPFATTGDLVKLCDKVLGRSKPGKLPLPTLVFQAVRIAVNDELEQLNRGLYEALKILAPGGKLAVISFHSLEDRIVKNFFRNESTECLCPPGLPICCCGHHAVLKLLTRHAVTANAEELTLNKRAACAKLRVAERLNN